MNHKIHAGVVDILIIEDDPGIQQLMQLALRIHHLEASLANDIASARKFLEHHSACLFITDRELPDGDGIDFTAILHQRFPTTPIVGCSTQDGVELRFKNAGATIFLHKPFHINHFGEAIVKLLGN